MSVLQSCRSRSKRTSPRSSMRNFCFMTQSALLRDHRAHGHAGARSDLQTWLISASYCPLPTCQAPLVSWKRSVPPGYRRRASQ
jgi:hypothetical protein